MEENKNAPHNFNPNAEGSSEGGNSSSQERKINKTIEGDLPMLSDRSAKSKLESVYYSVVSHTTASGRIIFGNNEIELFPDRELPQYASMGTKAFIARDLDSNIEYVAILCGRSELPRLSSIGSYRNLKTANILKLVAAGVVNWIPEGRQRFALIFQQPAGRKVINDLSETPKAYTADFLINSIIRPAITVLFDLENIDLVHGAIRLDNMFIGNSEGTDSFVMGECLSSAPSFYQHPIYEMASRAMVQPSKRGPGTIKDDLYALGMCVAMMVKGKNFTLDRTENQLVADKLQYGSYAAIIGKEALPGGIAEFLRGVLNDDIEMRWDIDDCMKWLDGRRINPKQGRSVILSPRPFLFKEKEYYDLRVLANAFSSNINDATSELSKSFFIQWMRRNFDDKDLKERFEKIYNKDQISTSDRYISMICSALDPNGPIRFGGTYIYPSGFGVAISESIKRGENLQIYIDLIREQLLANWINQVFDHFPDAAGLISMLEKCRISVSQKAKGYGLERVLYIANPGCACLSPYFERHYVLTPGALLLALEDISAQGDRPEMILDRHMVSFLSVRESNLIDTFLGLVNSSDDGKRIIGVLRVLNGIQRRFSTGPVPGVSKWVASLIQAAVENYNDRDLRSGINKELSKMQNSGILQDMVNLVDNQHVVQEDIRRFRNACFEYKALMAEKHNIESYLNARVSYGRSTGRQVAMVVSSIVAFITIALYAFIYFYGKF